MQDLDPGARRRRIGRIAWNVAGYAYLAGLVSFLAMSWFEAGLNPSGWVAALGLMFMPHVQMYIVGICLVGAVVALLPACWLLRSTNLDRSLVYVRSVTIGSAFGFSLFFGPLAAPLVLAAGIGSMVIARSRFSLEPDAA